MRTAVALPVAIAVLGAAVPAFAQTATPTPPTSQQTPPTTAAAPAAAPASTTVTLPTPGMTGPLGFSPNPLSVDLGPLGKNYITGVLSGLGFAQTNPLPTNRNGQIDLSNAQIMIQKTDGVLQYYVQIGAYTLPSLGSLYIPVTETNGDLFGPVPQAYIKIQPTSNFSIEGGKLPTLIGAEYTFSFENMNVERGLLWNQEPAVSRGLQANYTLGPVAFALSFNDGYYSDVFNWISGSATWTINSSNTLEFAGAGNLGQTSIATYATPLVQNNSSIFNIIYTYNSGPLTVTPYVQWSHVSKNQSLGFNQDAWTYGAAVLATYTFNPHFSLGGRIEYIGSTGSLANGSPNLLYGPGSKAFSFTATPTFMWNRYFLRGDVSVVSIIDGISGYALGPSFAKANQVRGILETGVLF